MTTPAPAIRLAMLLQEPSDDRVLPRTVGQACVLQLRMLLRQYPAALAAVLLHCKGDASADKTVNIGNIIHGLKQLEALADNVNSGDSLDDVKKALKTDWLTIVETCVSGTGLNLAIRDWPGETQVPA